MPHAPRLRSGPLVGLTFLGGIGGGLARSEHPYPRPGADAAAIRRSIFQPNGAPRISAAGQLLSAASLIACTADVARLAGPGERAAAIAGGPTHGAGFGLLLGALGLAGRRTGALPRRLADAALATAVPNLLSPLYLVADPAAWLIPIGRFPGLVVCAIAGARGGGAR